MSTLRRLIPNTYTPTVNCREHTPTAENSLDVTIKTYQNLIAKMPKPNQYLLLYVLDLLSVFARKSEVNLMTAPSRSFVASRRYARPD